jgi:hypothetical protein
MTSDKAQILRPRVDFATNMTNLAELQKTSRDRRETRERNRTYILKKKARTAENLKGMVEKQKRNRNTFSRIKQGLQKTGTDRRGTEEENRTHSQEESKQLQKTWRHRRGTEREQNIFSTKKATIAENMKGSKRNTTESPKESKNCRKREEIEEEQKRTEEPLLEQKATRS